MPSPFIPVVCYFFPSRAKEAKKQKKKDNTWSQVIFSAVPEALRKLPLTQTHNGGSQETFINLKSKDKDDLHFSRAFRDNRWWSVSSPLWFNFLGIHELLNIHCERI